MRVGPGSSAITSERVYPSSLKEALAVHQASPEESQVLPPGSHLQAAQLLILDMKKDLQELTAAMESAEDDTRVGETGLVGILQLIGSESAPECEAMGDDLGEDFDFDGNLTN